MEKVYRASMGLPPDNSPNLCLRHAILLKNLSYTLWCLDRPSKRFQTGPDDWGQILKILRDAQIKENLLARCRHDQEGPRRHDRHLVEALDGRDEEV